MHRGEPVTLHRHGRLGDNDGVLGHGVRLEGVDLFLEARGQAEDDGDTDDADAGSERSQKSPALFAPDVVIGELQRDRKIHVGLLQAETVWGRCLTERIAVRDDLSVLKTNQPVGILFCDRDVVGYHHDQPVARDLLYQVHDLAAGLCVQGPRWLVA
ncbi:hypothetical protein SDC9_132130 [bioreactor metagenome]|uniref:Uncharacterized protein n=1 Tax=bioreactor metagenome TaxID=1076179 RepID=A0A645D7Y2_9ZZZZ